MNRNALYALTIGGARTMLVGRPSWLAVFGAAAMLLGCGTHSALVPFSQLPASAHASNSAEAPLVVLHVFRAAERGSNPYAPVVADSAGNLYGETYDEAKPSEQGGCGSVFKLAFSGGRYVETTLHRFRNKPDGCSPAGGLTFDSNGAIYGATFWGGLTPGWGSGTVFKLTPAGSGYSYSVIYRFKAGRDGAWPVGGVIVGRNGVLYGATQYGAAYACEKHTEGCGIVYSLTPNGSRYSESILHVFTGGKDGILPISSLAMDAGGALYGTTWLGGGEGSLGIGTVYKVSPSGSGYTEKVIHAFRGIRDGATPVAPVILDSSGAVVGTTVAGGDGSGVVFRLTPSGSSYKEMVLYRFRGGEDGSQPQAPVTDVGGTLYGTTTDGASYFPCYGNCGTVFALTPTTRGYTHTVVARFGARSGWDPSAGLIEYGGALYGTAFYQGRSNSYSGGSVFSLTP
jgi:uncharacterized repeat protein (TIGR03803 family)